MIFGSGNSGSPLTVNVGTFVVGVATVQPADDPTKDPSWGNWQQRPELKFLGAFYGSSVAGMSYAKVKLAPGAPQYPNVDVEQYSLLNVGDRVCILQVGTGSTNILFSGYCLEGRIEISDKGESLVFRIAGPEWIWGDHELGGSDNPIAGQVRRLASADDAWAKAGDPSGVVTASKDLFRFTGDRCEFNPLGRKNMSLDDCLLDLKSTIKGRVWDSPERLVQGTLRTAHWTVAQACKTLELWFNDPATSGISHPDWANAGIDDTKTLPHTEVEGMGLWGALKRVCGPEYGFYVDPRPSSSPAGTSWGPFKITFFTRGQGPAVNVFLNKRGTSVAQAKASVVRVEAMKSISKTVTKATVLCRQLTHVKLQYLGGRTPGIGGPVAREILQNGWTDDDVDFSDYVGDNGAVDGPAVGASGQTDTWDDQYCTDGKQFEKFKHAGRLFVWNESGEYFTGPSDHAPIYAIGSSQAYTVPDMTTIADGTGDDAGKFCRKRRRIIDTPYYDTSIDQWRRVKPTLLLSATHGATDTIPGPWTRVRTHLWRLDPERGSFWITAKDISEWCPLGDDQDPNEPKINDERSFATLLYTGCLRMTLEGSVEADCCIKETADRQDIAGSPFVREMVIRGDKEYILSSAYVDGLASVMGLDQNVVDNTPDAKILAEQYRNSGQDQVTHASLLCSADWPLQPIGGILTAIQGRTVSLTGGPAGRGAQIVAVHLDPEALKWEMLTESVALKLRRMDRMRVGKGGPKRWNNFRGNGEDTRMLGAGRVTDSTGAGDAVGVPGDLA